MRSATDDEGEESVACRLRSFGERHPIVSGESLAGHRRFMAVARAMVESAGVDDAEERARWLADCSDGVLLHQLTARHDEPVDIESHRRAIRRLLLD